MRQRHRNTLRYPHTETHKHTERHTQRETQNVQSDPHGEFRGKNILYIAHTIDETARQFGKTPEAIEKILESAKEELLRVRAKKLRPSLDDKILTDWNGLMISSFAMASRVLKEPRYRDAAKRAADFILDKMKRKDGRLLHRWRDDEAAIPGFLEDYAFFIHGLVDLYEATFDPRYLEEARDLSQAMFRLFWDEVGGGFFFTGNDSQKLIARAKELYDGAIPSGNSVATLSLVRTGRLTMNRELENLAQSTVDAFSQDLSRLPSGYPQMLIAFDFILGPSREIVIAAEENQKGVEAMLAEIYGPFLPKKVVAFHPPKGERAKKIEALAPFVKKQLPLKNKPTAYVCKNYVCDLPTADISKLKELLQK